VYGGDCVFAALSPDLRNATPFFLYWSNREPPPGFFEARDRFIAENRPLLVFEGDKMLDIGGGRKVKLGDPADPKNPAVQMERIIKKFGYKPVMTFPGEMNQCVLLEPL
jgi:hypothetical protein